MIIKRVSDKSEIEGIKKLQTANLKSSLPAEEQKEQGFVTAVYSYDFLEKMHAIEPAVIAKENDEVVGYALVATKAIRGSHPLLDDLFNQIDRQPYQNKQLGETDYVVVGQLCVAKSHRGKGLVQQLYGFFREELSARYTYGITDVDENNMRSVNAHLKTGFQIIGTLVYGGSRWHIVLWDWRK